MERTIFHVDVNSAFLSWEAVYRMKHLGGRLDLRTVCSAVGGDVTRRHGIILAKSIPARACGIKTGETVFSALKKCPELVLVPPNYNLYQRSSDALIRLLKEYTPLVEQYSIDEAYMDMTESTALFGPPEAAAETIRERILQELGFTVNIGVAQNKLLAKMASDFKKPNRVHTLWKEQIPVKMWPLPVSELFFIGRATYRKLKGIGITTIGELAQSDPDILRRHLGKQGEVIWGFANGVDLSAVEAEAPPNKDTAIPPRWPLMCVTRKRQNWSSCPWRKRWAPDSGRTVLKLAWWRWESGIICSNTILIRFRWKRRPTSRENCMRRHAGPLTRRGIRRRSAIWASIQVTSPQRNPGRLGSSTAWITKSWREWIRQSMKSGGGSATML